MLQLGSDRRSAISEISLSLAAADSGDGVMDYSKKVIEPENGPHQEQESETQIDAASPSSSVELSENGAHPCPTCPSVFTSSHELTNHLRDHNSPRSTDCSGEEDYSCGVCNKVLSSASSLDRHVLVHSGERPFKCKYCDMSFTTNGNMNRHVRCTHRMISPNSCTDSEGSSGSERPATTSQDEYNNNEIARRNSPELIDDRQQPSPSNNRANKRKCPNEDIGDMEDQRRHKILLNNAKMTIGCRPEDEQKIFGCPVCGQDFASSAILESHMERVHPGSPATCETCNQSFKNHRALNLHRSMRHYKKNTEGNNSRSLRNTVDGFRDLTFIDFSSIKFPTIARAMCERELHRPASGEANRFQCMKCLHAFPCRQAQLAHEKECKGPYKNKRNSNDNNNNNDISTNNNLEAEVDDPSPQPDDPKTKREIFFAVLDLQNKSLAHEMKELREPSEIREPKETKDLADIPSILSVSLNGLQTFPRSDASTPENNIKFNPNIGSSGSSGTCSSEFNEEEAQDVFTAEFRKMKLKGEFPCRLCTSVFPNLRALKGHNRAHMNIEPGMSYPCNMCPYTSNDKGALMKHLRSHNGDRPFECSLCNYAFTTKANCERHVKNRHGMISKEDVKNALIYHPSEDSTNDNVERSSPRVIREDVRKTLIYPNEREEIPQQQIHYPSITMDCNPGPSNVRAEMLINRYEKSDTFARVKMQALNLVKRNADETNLSHDLIVKSNYSKIDDDIESGSSDGSVSLVSDTKTDAHQRIQASPMNLTKPSLSSGLSSGEDGPLDLSMDVLDLSRKRKKENEDSSLQEEKRFKSNQQELYATNPALLLTQALLNRARENSSTTSLETLYANTIYRNFGTLTSTSMIPPYFLTSHMFSQELATKGRLQKELVRGLQLTGGSTLSVDLSLPSTSYTTYSQSRETPATSSEQNAYVNLMSAQMTNQIAPSREKTDGTPLNDPVKMVLKNGVLIPKQKQRRYRTERPFTCEHCTARFTLRSNMERHIKQQHPQYWSQRPRGGHSTRGRPPGTGHSNMIQNTGPSASHVAQSYSSILSNVDTTVITSTDYGTHPISDQVKYAILAQQLKVSKMDDNNDSDDEMVIDEESADRDAQEPQTQREPGTSLLRDQLESSEGVKDIVIKAEATEPAEKILEETSKVEQATRNNVDSASPEQSAAIEDNSARTEETTIIESVEREQGKLEDGTPDLASVSKLLDNASQQYQQFQPQYLSDEEGPVASTSGNNSGSEKSDSMNSLNSGNDSSSNKKKKKKKKSAYSMAPNRVICPYCDRQFPWTSSLRRHILTHTGQKPYQCIHCSHHFTTKSNCDRHLLRKHKAKANKMRRARNSSSPDVQVVASSSSSSNGSNTFSMRNVPERPFKCHQCPSSTFATLSNLKKHRSSKHRKTASRSESSDQQNSPSQCAAQNEQSDYESHSSSMSDNMENASSAVPVAKPTSNASPSINDATRSRKSPRLSPSPGDVPFKCYLCDSGFSERQDCLDHIKTNHRRSYEMLKAKGALDMASMNVDAAEDQISTQQHPSDGEEKKGRFPDYSNRKVVCAFCMRRFWSAEDLRRHMRTHTGERPFECDICTRKFTLKHSMLRHRKKHESVESAMYIGNSGDEENPPAQPPTITPRSQQHSPISTNTSRPRTQDRISLPTVAAVATADAAPCALMRYNHYDNMATLTGRMANDGPQGAASAPPLPSPPPPAEVPSESGDNDLISNLLGIREKGLLDKVLLSSADDAAKLLGVNHSE